MRVQNGAMPEEDLGAERGKGLSYSEWKAGYLYYENQAGAFTNNTGAEYPFPVNAIMADSYSGFLKAND